MDFPDFGLVRQYDRVRAVRVYSVCDESRYLVVRNVPALGCTDELLKLFGLYGKIEEYRILDEEDCEPFTDVYWIKFAQISSARFSKRKLDDYKFVGNLLQVAYAPEYETLEDTKDKLEERRRTVLHRIRQNALDAAGLRQPTTRQPVSSRKPLQDPLLAPFSLPSPPHHQESLGTHISAASVGPQQDFVTRKQRLVEASMEATVQSVRAKLDRVSDAGELARQANQASQVPDESKEVDRQPSTKAVTERMGPAAKKPRQDGRRRI